MNAEDIRAAAITLATIHRTDTWDGLRVERLADDFVTVTVPPLHAYEPSEQEIRPWIVWLTREQERQQRFGPPLDVADLPAPSIN